MGFSIDVSERIKLTPQQQHLWEETMAAFSWTTPPFVHVLYELLNPEGHRVAAVFLGTNRVPNWLIAGTNGKRLFLVAERFFELDLMERLFILAHEVGHVMLGHIIAGTYYRKRGCIELGFKKLPYIPELANMAQDLVINDMLIQSRIGKFVKGGLHDPHFATFKDSWIDIYEKMLPPPSSGKKKGQQPGQGEQPRGSKQRFDEHMEFGEGEPEYDPDAQVTKDDMEAEVQRAQQATAAAMELARAQGKLPAALEYLCKKVLEPTIDWNDHLKSQFARRLGTGTYDFRRPDRRLLVRDIVSPGRSGFRAEIIILGADNSGSIYSVPLLIERWMGECGGMMEDVRPREVHVVWCDAEVQKVVILTDPGDVEHMRNTPISGGGGTDFRPVFEYAKTLDHPIDCLAYLTDGDGDFPDEAPPFPVIWGSIKQPPEHYPFGDVVMIPVPKEHL